MDYKDIYLSTYKPILLKQENWIKHELKIFRKRNKSFQAANYKIDDALRNHISTFDSDLIKSESNNFLFTFDDRDKLYQGNKDENLESILKDEILELYKKHHNGYLFNSYDQFLLILGEFKGLFDAKRFYEKIIPLVEILYNDEKIDKIKLEEIGVLNEHSIYNDYKKNLDLEKTKPSQNDKQELKTLFEANNGEDLNEIDSIIKKITKEERIFIISFLMSLSTKDKVNIPDTEIVRVLYLTDGIFDTRIFTDQSKDLTYMKKFTNGIYYYENLLKRKKLKDSILNKTIDLKIDHFREYFENNFN